MPTTSIIIPAFNAAKYLGAAIESALSQTLPATQVIVVDDGSTDETGTIARQFGDAVWSLHQANAGVSAARNHGAREATAEWLLFLDADDLMCSEALNRLVARASSADFGVVYGQTEYFWEGTEKRRLHGKGTAEGGIPSATVANFWKSTIATPGAALIRRSLFEEAGGFRTEFNTTADRDFWLRAGMLAPFAYVEEVVIEKREHGANMSGDKSRARKQAAEVQLSFLRWCDERGLTRPAVDERMILEQNLERSLAERSIAAAEWLCAEARRRDLSGPIFTRAQRLLSMPGFARDLELKVRSYFER